VIHRFIERLYYRPSWYHLPVIALLAPLSLLYGAWMALRRKTARRERFDIPIISVGNLVIGGSGKTPFVIELARRYAEYDVAVVSRGYGRKSEGLVVVSRRGEVLVDAERSGDEAMVMAQALPQASVIVSEDRKAGIRRAIKEGARLVILDDGFNRVDIEKYEIVLHPLRLANALPLPAGPLREFTTALRRADIVLREGKHYSRKVTIQNPTKRMVLATSVARPERLEAYLPEGVLYRYYLPDHAYFDKARLEALLKRFRAESLLVTQKDAVKLETFKLPLSIMRLQLNINPEVLQKIDAYVRKERV
jgi:tetraacyldisaccharide 4'-kinase